MSSISTIIFLGTRVILASIIGLMLQIGLLVKIPNYLLIIQEAIKVTASNMFDTLQLDSQYHIAYNLIGGDNIIVHTFFVLLAYISILVLVLIFKSGKSSRSHPRTYH